MRHGDCVWRSSFSVIYGFVMSCKKWNNVCTLVTNCLCTHSSVNLVFISLECYFGVYFPRCCATREINTKITLSWAHKQFATRVHTLFSMSELTMALFTRIYWSLALMNYSISQEICTRFCCALLCCRYAIVHNEFTWSIYPYSSGLLCWHWGNR